MRCFSAPARSAESSTEEAALLYLAGSGSKQAIFRCLVQSVTADRHAAPWRYPALQQAPAAQDARNSGSALTSQSKPLNEFFQTGLRRPASVAAICILNARFSKRSAPAAAGMRSSKPLGHPRGPQTARSPPWPQMQTSELLADLQWIASEERGTLTSQLGSHRDSLQQQLCLIKTLEAADAGKDTAALAAASALFQCEWKRQQVLQQVLSACLQCELLRFAFLAACSSVSPKVCASLARPLRVAAAARTATVGVFLKVDSCDSIICMGAAGALSFAQLPSAAQSVDTYWERLCGMPVVFEEGGRCELDGLDLKQMEKDLIRETFSVNTQLLKGADGMQQLLIGICRRLREAEESAARKSIAEARANGENFASCGLPETVSALVTLGLLPTNVCCMDSENSPAAPATPAVWTAVARLCCTIRLLSVSSRTHGGGAAFAAVFRAFSCPALPVLLQPDNRIIPSDQPQEGDLQSVTPNVTEIVLSSFAQQQEGPQGGPLPSDGPLLAVVHTTTPFKLIFPEHERYSTPYDDQRQDPTQQSQQEELLKRLDSVTVAAHFFATLRSVLLPRPSAELRQFDSALADQVRTRSDAATVIAAVLTEELRQTAANSCSEAGFLWLPVERSQQWVLGRNSAASAGGVQVEEDGQPPGL
ncbi:uncharacterized protein LOC34623126 [Cyclospora cayetanensis]|uniref:Uncharacterized protein LOC34623126 n=1 Tax=Cyclospora cayetanensis TaxID=88456 RepID=A0A6P6RZ24_9EIME|nr:uncharacterized protein LOC34623126 [Cyclospora cayetanensis]